MKRAKRQRSRTCGKGLGGVRRRGATTIWLLSALPVLLVALFGLCELGFLWQARAEIHGALDAAALGAVRTWGRAATSPAADWTLDARRRAQTLAAANTVAGRPILIELNQAPFHPTTNPNENAVYLPGVGPPPTGNIVFGVVTTSGLATTFDTTRAPSCGGATVKIDATGHGNLFSGNRNSWGVAFQSATNPALRIRRIEIDLSTAALPSRFRQAPRLLTASDTHPTAAVKDRSNNFQQDVVGFASLSNNMNNRQIRASFPSNQVLRLDFSAGGGDDGFAPGDRFRFSQRVTNPGQTQNRDGDDVSGATITVEFNDGSTMSGRLVDDLSSRNAALNPRQIDPLTGTFVVHPSRVPDVPAPPRVNGSNNGQSFVRLTGASSGEAYAVRVQAVVPLTAPVGGLLGLASTRYVTVESTAVYDCATGRARLLNVDNYSHP